MRPALCDLLYNRYPEFYLRCSQSPDSFYISCDDGWFGIVDALSKTLVELDCDCHGLEIKSASGVLTYRCVDRLNSVNRAFGAAVSFSHLIREVNGQRGDLDSGGLDKALSLEGFFRTSAPLLILEDKPVFGFLRRQTSGRAVGSVASVAERRSWSKEDTERELKNFNGYALAHDCVIDIPAWGFRPGSCNDSAPCSSIR